MDDGYISLHKKIIGWEWYKNNNVKCVFIHLLLLANFKDSNWQGISVLRGQTITSYGHIAEALGISMQSVRTAINKLKSTGELTYKSTNKFSLITIVKYNDYQNTKKKLTSNLTDKSTINQQTTNKQLTTANKDNKDNNNSPLKINNTERFIGNKDIILKDAFKLYSDKDCNMAIEDFIGYCETHKTKWTDYRKAFFNWVREDKFAKYKKFDPFKDLIKDIPLIYRDPRLDGKQ